MNFNHHEDDTGRILFHTSGGIITFLAAVLAIGLVCSAVFGATLQWDQHIDESVTGYTVLYGTESGVYDQVVDVGNQTSYALPELELDTPYFFVIQCYNEAGLSSAPSPELAYTFSVEPEGPPEPPTLPPDVVEVGPGVMVTMEASNTLDNWTPRFKFWVPELEACKFYRLKIESVKP